MILKVERVQETYKELDELVHDYYASTVAAEDMPPLDFNWSVYCALEHAGMLKLYTARNKDDLVGFVLYHVYPHLHHRTYMTAACDTLAVKPEQRGKGIGRALMEYAEPQLKKCDVKSITHQFRTCYTAKPLFPKLGYKLIEYGYLKELD
jgi:GNAT superfamily N-acetyltransferase